MSELMYLRPADLDNRIGQATERAHLSYSSVSTFINCPKKFEWEKIERLEPISRAHGLTMGKAFTVGLEHGDPQAGALQLDDRPVFDQIQQDALDIDKAVVVAAITAYLNKYGAKSPLPGKLLEREYGYRIRLRSPYTGAYSRTYDLLGYADGVIDHGDHLELIEDKFVGRLDTSMVRRVRLDRQVGLEAYALWRVTGKPVRKIRYRFTKKPSIKQKQNESAGEYMARVTQDYLDRPDFYLIEEITFRSEDDLLQLEGELWEWAEQLRGAHNRSFYARNTTSCTQYGGCAFIDLCSMGQQARPLYRVREERAA